MAMKVAWGTPSGKGVGTQMAVAVLRAGFSRVQGCTTLKTVLRDVVNAATAEMALAASRTE